MEKGSELQHFVTQHITIPLQCFIKCFVYKVSIYITIQKTYKAGIYIFI